MKSSLVSLWLTLGFSAGLAFGWLAFRSEPPRVPPAKAPSIATASDRAEVPIDAGTLRAAERIFARWGGYAVWEDDVTEVAVWDQRRKRHGDFYEVRRHGGKFYFRSLPALTRPILDHGVNAALPLAFTEPQWSRDQFYRDHPDYDPATAPRVDLPPRPPEPFATSPHGDVIPPGTQSGYPGTSDGAGRPRLTNGAGG